MAGFAEVRIYTTRAYMPPPTPGSDYVDVLPQLLLWPNEGLRSGGMTHWLDGSAAVAPLRESSEFWFWVEAIDTAWKSSGIHFVGEHSVDAAALRVFLGPSTDPFSIPHPQSTTQISSPPESMTEQMLIYEMSRLNDHKNFLVRAQIFKYTAREDSVKLAFCETADLSKINGIQFGGTECTFLRAGEDDVAVPVSNEMPLLSTHMALLCATPFAPEGHMLLGASYRNTSPGYTAVPNTWCQQPLSYELSGLHVTGIIEETDYFPSVLYGLEIRSFPHMPDGVPADSVSFDSVLANFEMDGTGGGRTSANSGHRNGGTKVMSWFEHTNRATDATAMAQSSSSSYAPSMPSFLFRGVRFDGASQFLRINHASRMAAPAVTVFVAFRPDNNPDTSVYNDPGRFRAILANQVAQAGRSLQITDANVSVMGTTSRYPDELMPAADKWSFVAVRAEAGSQTAWIDQHRFISVDGPGYGALNGDYHLGKGTDGSMDHFGGEVGEVLMVPSALEDGMVVDVISYLMRKWKDDVHVSVF